MRLLPGAPSPDVTFTCPKCGFNQAEAPDCIRCGIIFAKFQPPPLAADQPPQAEATQSAPTSPQPHTKFRSHGTETASSIRSLIRILPWITMASSLLLVFMIMREVPPIQIDTDPHAAERISHKLAHLELALNTKRAYTLELSEAELNQWMRDNLAIASAHQSREAGIYVPPGRDATIQEVQSALKDIRVNLIGNYLRAYTLFTIYGREISLQLEGTLEAAEGYLRLKPIKGKIGSFPIPSSTLDHVVQRLFDSPQNRDKFHLPSQIESVRIENSTLVMAFR